MRLLLFALFIAAFTSQAVLVFAYWVRGMNPNALLTWSALALTGVCVLVMGILAAATQDRSARWLSVGLIGVVALAFSALTIISIGILIAPFALALTIISCVMLILGRRSGSWERQ